MHLTLEQEILTLIDNWYVIQKVTNLSEMRIPVGDVVIVLKKEEIRICPSCKKELQQWQSHDQAACEHQERNKKQ